MKTIIQDPTESVAGRGIAVIVMTCQCGVTFATDEYSVLPENDADNVAYIDDCPVCGTLNMVQATSEEEL